MINKMLKKIFKAKIPKENKTPTTKKKYADNFK